jgi:hypothetical protein
MRELVIEDVPPEFEFKIDGPISSGFDLPFDVYSTKLSPAMNVEYEKQRAVYLTHGLRRGFARQWAQPAESMEPTLTVMVLELGDAHAPSEIMAGHPAPATDACGIPGARGAVHPWGMGDWRTCAVWFSRGEYLAGISLMGTASGLDEVVQGLVRQQYDKLGAARTPG